MPTRPEISDKTLSRLQKHGKFPPRTTVDYMINYVLDEVDNS